jgi:DNA-binding LacI/PurR family transcriptional regulator
MVGNGFLDDPRAEGLTISDVARRASVSPATVSRVLNGDSRVGEAYRTRVLQAVEELDYRPNVLARNLRRQRTATIGVVVPDIENPHFGELVRSVEDQAFDAGYRVLVCNTDETAAKQRAYLEALIDERVLGVIISPSDPGDAQISRLLDLRIPVVACDREVADARADAVLADNVKAIRIAGDVLVAEGHVRIAFIGGRADVETGAERLAGYEMAMRAAQLEPLVVDGDFRLERAEAAVAGLLRRDPRPTALIVANNLMTLGALRAVRDAGLRVPGDIALLGVDDPPWSALVDPPLTTLAQPVRAMAADAMELLLQRVAGARTHPRRIVHPFELRERASTGRPSSPSRTGSAPARLG